MSDDAAIRNRMLAVITVILATAALKASYAVTMPLAVAAVIIAAIWPVKPWLDRFLPSGVSYILTVLLLLCVFAGFTAAVYFAAAEVVRAFGQNWDQFSNIYDIVSDWASRFGLQEIGGQQGLADLIGFGQALLQNAYTVLVYVGFIAILVILGLPEVPMLRAKIRGELGAKDRQALIDTVDEIAEKVRQYLGVTLLTSTITGIACAAWAFVLGLELALVWGILNFLLNFIPVIGNIVGVIPPTLYALIQFQSWTWSAVVFVGYAVIQIVISNFLFPMVQGYSLFLSPIAIMVALAFWSWVWGIPGALVAVPLTAALVIVCQHFHSVKWIATLLSGAK
jgi:AI-2 transport protein TqsA